MNKVLILILSFAFWGIASSGSLFGSIEHGLREQNMHQNPMSSLQAMSQQELMRQKFVLDILMNLQQRLDATKMLKEYGINEISSITRNMCNVEMDEQMMYVMDLCNKCLQKNLADLYSLSNLEQMRQSVGLYRILVTARDWQTLQEISILARKCINSPIFAYSFMMAIRDRDDTRLLIIPRIYEVLPDVYFSEEDIDELEIHLRNQEDNDVDRIGGMWMPFRNMQKLMMIQNMRGKLHKVPLSVNTNQNIEVVEMKNGRERQNTMDLFLEDLDLKAFVDNLLFDLTLVMNQGQSKQDEMQIRMQMNTQDQSLKEQNKMRMRNYMQDQERERQGLITPRGRKSYMNVMLDRDLFDRRQNQLNSLYDRDIMGRHQDQNNKMATMYGRNMVGGLQNQGDNMDNWFDRRQEQGYEMNLNNERNGMGRGDNQKRFLYDRDMLEQYGNIENNIKNQNPTVDVNDDRLLYVGRRHMNMQNDKNSAINMQRNMYPKKPWQTFRNDRVFRALAEGNPRGFQNIDTEDPYEKKLNDRRVEHSYLDLLQQQYENNIRQMSSKFEGNQGMRQRRSAQLMTDGRNQEGFVILHNIRQLLARVRLECKSLGEDDYLMPTMRRMEMRETGIDRELAMRLNKMRLNTKQSHMLMEHLNELENLINLSIEREIEMQKVNRMEELDIERVILNVLMGRLYGVSFVQMLDDLHQRIKEQNSDQDTFIMKRGIQIPIIMHFLARMNQILSMQQQYYGYRYKQDDLLLPSVTIHDVKVDNLRTFIDFRDDDLLNKLQCQDIEQCLERKQMIFGRQPRLNHKSFSIQLELTSDRDQNVIMRTFLAPKDQIIPADLMLLDTNIVQLRRGNNSIKRKSNEIMWTLKEKTSYSQLYQEVMMALSNENRLMRQERSTQNCKFPHHLLLPRGRPNGFQMRLVVVLSALDNAEILTDRRDMICAMGLGNIQLDRRLLGFPMDRYIEDIDHIEQLMNLSNIYMTDVSIFHDDK